MTHEHKRSHILTILSYIYKVYFYITHTWAKTRRTFYFEDYFRVYPDGIAFNQLGFRRKARNSDIKNYLNHLKFYKFASQFAKKKVIVDLGCGSGYGCEVLKKAGAAKVYGTDASKHSINYAKSMFKKYAEFSIQSITDLNKYPNSMFSICVSSEVLEHIKEYNMEKRALDEIKRITKKGGLIIIGTPNNEIVENHGFSYDEIIKLFKKHFSKFIVFENALIPFGQKRKLWVKRLESKKVGIIVSELINFDEIALIDNQNPEIKKGLKLGILKFGKYQINTKLLHNTHSWIIMAINE